jgi:hypothetical protein
MRVLELNTDTLLIVAASLAAIDVVVFLLWQRLLSHITPTRPLCARPGQVWLYN